jgi:phosphoglucomutase
MTYDLQAIIEKSEVEINHYLETALRERRIDRQSYKIARSNTIENLKTWLLDLNIDRISPNLKAGIVEAVEQGRWEDIVNAFRKKMSFGTGGIRGLMASNKESIIKLKQDGLDAKILKGPNTLNNIVVLQASAGVADFGRHKGYDKTVIGYDSRVQGAAFARVIAELFLAYGYTVFLFDAPCPYPEVTFAIPFEEIKADMGILISASHNDYRYNGYKLSCGNGSQFDPKERTEMYNQYISKATTNDIKLLPLNEAEKGQVVYLGGDKRLKDVEYFGHEDSIINIHKAHQQHTRSLLLKKHNTKHSLNIAYCAFHGAGRIAVPNLLKDLGFEKVKIVHEGGLFELDGLFPSFNSDPGREQQPDPGDPRAAKIAVEAFKKEYGAAWEDLDILIGTDPDADRCGIVVRVPEDQRFLYGNRDYVLLPADDMWALLVWYRLKYDQTINPEETFIAITHTTSDSIARIAESRGIGVLKTWVGFANLSAGVRDAWEGLLPGGIMEGRKGRKESLCHPYLYEDRLMVNNRHLYNLGAMEQSNGFSILGFPPKNKSSMGQKGHVRDKDGTFAAVLIAEVAEYAKQEGKSLLELIDEKIYLDPAVGLFVNYYEPDPLDGEYPGIEGDKIKKSILRRALELYQVALDGGLEIGGRKVKSAAIYRTGKYDHVYPPGHDFQFPDEGIRFYFDTKRLEHLTIRPSGTTNSLRFHIQLHSSIDGNGEKERNKKLIEEKKKLRKLAKTIANDIRVMLQAPRSSEID